MFKHARTCGVLLCVCAHVHWFGGLALSKTTFLLLCPHSSGGSIHYVWLRLLQGKPGVAEEQEEDAGALCMGERGPGAALNRPTKGKKMVQCHGNYTWMSFEWHDMSQAFLSAWGTSTSSLVKTQLDCRSHVHSSTKIIVYCYFNFCAVFDEPLGLILVLSPCVIIK